MNIDQMARQSISAYEAQIAKANAILGSDTEGIHLAIVEQRKDRSVRMVFAFDEDLIIEALQSFVSNRQESIRILSDGLS